MVWSRRRRITRRLHREPTFVLGVQWNGVSQQRGHQWNNEIQKKRKERIRQRILASNFKVTATHVKQSTASHRAKDSTRWYHGNKGKGQSKGGTKGFTKGKGKGMNNCEQGQRRWPTTPSFHDVLLLEQKVLVHGQQQH